MALNEPLTIEGDTKAGYRVVGAETGNGYTGRMLTPKAATDALNAEHRARLIGDSAEA